MHKYNRICSWFLGLPHEKPAIPSCGRKKREGIRLARCKLKIHLNTDAVSALVPDRTTQEETQNSEK